MTPVVHVLTLNLLACLELSTCAWLLDTVKLSNTVLVIVMSSKLSLLLKFYTPCSMFALQCHTNYLINNQKC